MDILNIATQTVIKSLLSFFEEMGMMGRSIEYPTAMVNDGLAGYRTLFGDVWKEFQFTNPLKKEVGYSTYTEPTIRQTVQDLAQKRI
ncbi:MAG: hypothetical protein HOC18_04485 [Candidatus Marinimicrobia bacterium]|nr:hypothetical protein [Candidatus Neomarinimicrobiota bacterium]